MCDLEDIGDITSFLLACLICDIEEEGNGFKRFLVAFIRTGIFLLVSVGQMVVLTYTQTILSNVDDNSITIYHMYENGTISVETLAFGLCFIVSVFFYSTATFLVINFYFKFWCKCAFHDQDFGYTESQYWRLVCIIKTLMLPVDVFGCLYTTFLDLDSGDSLVDASSNVSTLLSILFTLSILDVVLDTLFLLYNLYKHNDVIFCPNRVIPF